jgi:hypothetical protein
MESDRRSSIRPDANPGMFAFDKRQESRALKAVTFAVLADVFPPAIGGSLSFGFAACSLLSMGYAKELALEEQQQAYRRLGDRHACLACIGDTDLVRQLRDGLTPASCDPNGSYSDAASLGPAPKDMASTNRMSPAGIPMFYGAKDRQRYAPPRFTSRLAIGLCAR